MKKYLLSFLLVALFSVSAAAQKVPKPTLEPTGMTLSAGQKIADGIRLHDAGKYDEAIAKYDEVLKENPGNTAAMYEMAFSYFAKKDQAKALELSLKGAEYKSPQLVQFYTIIASVWDNQGKSADAIALYEEAVKLGEQDKTYEGLSFAYYNLGVSYARQKQYDKSRQVLKKAVEGNFAHTGSNYYLAEIYTGTKYKMPALLAAARVLSLETNTPRAKRASLIFLDTLKPVKKDEKGNINIFLNLDAPKDEGDFGMYDLMTGTLTLRDKKEDKGKTDADIFAEGVDTLIAIMDEDKDLKSTFVGRTYIPFLVEAKKKGHSKTLGYLVLQQNGDTEAEKWTSNNKEKLTAFADWAKNYQTQK